MVQGKTAMALAAGNAEVMQMLSTHGDCREALSSEVCNALFAICSLRQLQYICSDGFHGAHVCPIEAALLSW